MPSASGISSVDLARARSYVKAQSIIGDGRSEGYITARQAASLQKRLEARYAQMLKDGSSGDLVEALQGDINKLGSRPTRRKSISR
jgi:hypothetical protein